MVLVYCIVPTPDFQPLVEVKAIEQPEPVYNLIQPEQPEINELVNYFAGSIVATGPG